jgi:hypothetical protein
MLALLHFVGLFSSGVSGLCIRRCWNVAGQGGLPDPIEPDSSQQRSVPSSSTYQVPKLVEDEADSAAAAPLACRPRYSRNSATTPVNRRSAPPSVPGSLDHSHTSEGSSATAAPLSQGGTVPQLQTAALGPLLRMPVRAVSGSQQTNRISSTNRASHRLAKLANVKHVQTSCYLEDHGMDQSPMSDRKTRPYVSGDRTSTWASSRWNRLSGDKGSDHTWATPVPIRSPINELEGLAYRPSEGLLRVASPAGPSLYPATTEEAVFWEHDGKIRTTGMYTDTSNHPGLLPRIEPPSVSETTTEPTDLTPTSAIGVLHESVSHRWFRC